MSDISQFREILTALDDSVMGYLVALAGASSIALSIVEVYKTYAGGRKKFLTAQLSGWLSEQGLDQLAHLVFHGNRDAYLDQPIDECMERLRAALPVLVDYPEPYEALLRNLLTSRRPPDTDALLTDIEKLMQGGDGDAMLKLKRRLLDRCRASATGSQIAMEQVWKRRMQISTFVATTLFIFVPVWLLADLMLAITVGLPSALLAPVARDLVVVIQNARRA